MSGMRSWLTSTALGLVLLSVLALPPRASAQTNVCSNSNCKPCGNGQTCSSCDSKICPPTQPRTGGTTVHRRCCTNKQGVTHCSNFPSCPSVSK